jgi:hypothetical protein
MPFGYKHAEPFRKIIAWLDREIYRSTVSPDDIGFARDV